MNASHTLEVPAQAGSSGAQIRTVLLCDLVDSTGLIERLGDSVAVELMRQHDQLVRQLLREHGGREIDKSDGFLALFEHPVRAVAFALDYQRELRALGNAEGWPLSARVGIHVGDVLIWESDPADVARGAKRINVEGVAKPIAARLMHLARPGQILLSQVTEQLARRAAADLGELASRVGWQAHGLYRLKGVPAALAVHEVGEPGIAPLKSPIGTDKARRERPAWLRPPVIAAQAVAASALLAIVAMVALRSDEAIAFRERDWVVIGSLDNRTGDVRFDDALETALRISLEQSRHVNVLPDLRVRDALRRMGREPGDDIDRATGSEIALREGARALLLPSVVEVGGKLRVNLEVIEPNSQRTVYVESAQGVGADSAVASLGQVADSLRHRLGEAITDIEDGVVSLEAVTTPSVDALRAYSLGVRALAAGRSGEAEAHLKQALVLDPEFAMAHAAIGRLHFMRGEQSQAQGALVLALELAGRLSHRERLSLDALLAFFSQSKDFAETSKALLDLYPDHHVAAHNYAQFMWYANRYAEGLRYAEPATAPQSPTRASSTYLLGILRLAGNDLDGAIEAFEHSRSIGFAAGTPVMWATALAAGRRFQEAAALLDAREPENAQDWVEKAMFDLTAALDQGKWDKLEAENARLIAAAGRSVERIGWVGRSSRLALKSLDPVALDAGKDVEEFIESALDPLANAAAFDRQVIAMAVMHAAFVAADRGEAEVAALAMDAVAPILLEAPLPVLANLHRLVEAQLDLRAGHHQRAIAKLEPLLKGDELYLTHFVLAEAYAGLGRNADALREMVWLSRHRGRAYGESSFGGVLRMQNVMRSNQALLRAAELALLESEPDIAERFLAAYKQAWPEISGQAGIEQRVVAIERTIVSRRS